MYDWVLPMVGGLGLGSILKGVVDYWLSTKSKTDDRLYTEKKETYLGLLQALHDVGLNPSREASKAYGNWHNRCKLFGSDGVIVAFQKCIDTSGNVMGNARKKAYDDLFLEMRKDKKMI